MKNAINRVLVMMIAFVFMFVVFFFIKNVMIGNVVLNVDESYALGEKLQGTLSLAIERGDLIQKDTQIVIRLSKEDVLAEKTLAISEFLDRLEPVEIYETREICENITVENITENCTESINELNESVKLCENITTQETRENCTSSNVSDFYFNQEGVYTRDIQDFINYTFSEVGEYKLAFLIPSLNLQETRTLTVKSGGFAAQGFGAFEQANASGNVVFQCGTLDSPGDYTMNQSITNNSLAGACINITSQNITLDCVSYANYILSDDEVEGVYSNQINTTVKNCNITMAGTYSSDGGTAISLSSAHLSSVYNNIVTGKFKGISLSSTQNSSIYNNTIINNLMSLPVTGGAGIYLSSSSSNNITNNSFSGNYYGLYFASSSNSNNITGNNFNNDADSSIHFDVSSTYTGNYFENNNLYNCSTCVYMSRANGQTFSGGVMSNSSSLFVYLRGSSNNTFKNINFTGLSATNEIFLQTTTVNAVNNTFINCSYNISKESVAVGSELIRKWYYMAFVNDTSGVNVNNANVTAYNVSGVYNFNLTTDSTGYTSLGEIIDYINNGTRTYYSPYNIYAVNSSYTSLNHSFNASLGNNYKDVFTLDNAPPLVTIVSPLTANYSSARIDFNVSLNEIGSFCKFTINNWATNYTMTRFSDTYFNYTNSTMIEGYSTAKFWCNDSLNNTNATTSVTFFIDYTKPLISFGVGTENDATIFRRNWIYANVSVNETNERNITLILKLGNSIVNSTTFTNSARLINWTNLADGAYSYNASIFDTSGNFNTTETRTISLDTTPPRVNITFPKNNSYSVSNLTFNVTTNENSTCTYRLNDSLVNVTMSSLNNLSFNATNSSIGESSYIAYFYCNDSLGNLNASESVEFTIDRTAPDISLINVTSSRYYYFNVTDRSAITNCTLFLNGVAFADMTSVARGTVQTMDYLTSDGTYTVYVNCTDLANNIGKSNSSLLTVTSSVTSVTSSGGGGVTTSYNIIKLIFPEQISIMGNESIQIQFKIRNSGQVSLQNINLSGIVRFNGEVSDNLKVTLKTTKIKELKAGEERDVTMDIFSNTNLPGKYKISVTANVEIPKFSDWGDFFVEIKRSNETELEQVISFSERLLFDNPKCIELLELVKDAENLYLKGNTTEAISKARSAVEACKKAIASEQTKKVREDVRNILYYTVILSAAVLMLWFIVYIYQKVKLNKSRRFRYMKNAGSI